MNQPGVNLTACVRVLQATPHLSAKRKSLHGRRLRPKSVVDASEGLSADDIPSRVSQSSGDTPTVGEESLDSVSELAAAAAHNQLQHLVKGRPRRAKTRAPTRPMVRPDEDAGDEGLDVFWRGAGTPTGASSPGDVTPRSRSTDSLGTGTRPTTDDTPAPGQLLRIYIVLRLFSICSFKGV